MWAKLKKLLRYYGMGFVLDLKSNIAYPTTFWFAVTTIPLWAFIQILLIETIYGLTDSFLGYTKFENYVLFGTFKIVQSLASLFFFVRLEDLADKIRGRSDWSLDTMLLKPIDSQVFATTGKYWFGSISSFLAGLGMVWYGLVQETHVIGVGQVLGYGYMVVLGVFFLYLLFLFIQTWLFWLEYLQIGEALWFTTHAFGQYPRQMYKGYGNIFFNIVFPITLMASVPVEYLFGKIGAGTLALYTLIIVILFWLTRMFWQYSIKKYSSFSS
ncbi:MAG: ABC-2 family transporter protein [Microgenomates group bacterium]